MFSREELLHLAPKLPPDFEEKSAEFWNYVEEKLNPLSARIKKVYHERLGEGGLKDLEEAKLGESLRLVRKLLASGSELQPTEDAMLVAESESWLNMLKTNSHAVLQELYEESLKERDAYMVRSVDWTLKEGEVGVLLVQPGRALRFPEDVKVIRMAPFDPADYLNSWLTGLRLRRAEA